MLSLWKLRVGVEAYYLAHVASGLDEYYTGAGEAPGVWMGGGSPIIGLGGQVAPDDLRAVLAGLAPDTGLTPNGTQLATSPRRVPGFDLTFSVPKSVSVLYALGDPLVQAAVVDGCEAAVTEALGWLEREACFVRRGTNNAANRQLWGVQWGTRRLLAEGFVAAGFRHRTSRAGDPHLHWHVLVANLARGVDGRWSALDGTALYTAKRTAGVMFQTAMRRELTARLGVEWGPLHRDTAEIAGVPGRVRREFSRRHDEIAEWLDSQGMQGPSAATQALLATRPPKQAGAPASIEAEWVARATALGWGPDQLEALLADASAPAKSARQLWVIREVQWQAGEPTRVTRVVGFEEWLDWLLTSRVTANDGTFTRFELTQAIAANVPAGTTIEAVEAVVQRALASTEIVPVGDHWIERQRVDGPIRSLTDDRALRYTARSLIAVERRLLRHLADGFDAGVGVIDPAVVNEAIARSTLGDDQEAAVRTLTCSGDRIAVLVGRAGTGKTHTLGTLRRAYENAGWEVIGLAPLARAARELKGGAGIASTTLARHLVEQRPVTASTVVVVDEAGTAGTRDLTAIVDQATSAGAKVVLVGDHRQLPEVPAGGGFRAALDTLGDRVAELLVNRRQQHPWEHGALDELRHGDVATAFAAYRDHGRVVLADNPADLHALALGDWLSTPGDTLLLAGTRAQARLLNRHARQLLAANGQLDLTGEVEIAGRSFAVGDRVVLCRNHPTQHLTDGTKFAVDNGMRGTIVALDDTMTVRLAYGDDVVLDAGYLNHGWVDHGYALTVHKALGVTCDHVLVVGPNGLYREAAYVALSRAVHSARIYVTSAQAAELDERHQYGIPLPSEPDDDPEADLLERLDTSGAKTLVTIEDPEADRIAALADSVPVPELVRRARHARDVEARVDAPNPVRLRAELTAASDTRTHLDVGRRVRAIDRDNVGHVLSIDDEHGTCTINFESTTGRHATKTYAWSGIVVIDHPEPVEPTPQAEAALAGREADLEAAEVRWIAALGAHGVTPGDADRYRRAMHVEVDRAAHQLRAEPSEWLTTWLGHRPASAAGAAVWDDATTRIAQHRLVHAIPDGVPDVGPRPAEPAESDRWQTLMLRILEDRCWLIDHGTPEPQPLRTRAPVEVVERQQQLRELLSSAPDDQRALVDRLVHSQLDAAELHEYLVAAANAQDERRDWIITNWPHLVELEQLNQLLATQDPLAHSPATQPEPVRDVLNQLRRLAPAVENREQRTLAELDQLEIDADPVRRLEARHHQLRNLVARAATPAEQDALTNELATTQAELRELRRARAVDKAFGQYSPEPFSARAARVATITHEVLTTQPDWVVDHVRHLHDTGRLTALDLDEIAARIGESAIHRDLHGQLPATWPEGPAPAAAPVVPAPELEQ
jgi:conjugative relaxase-like TrwC/TraI family protein